MSIFPEAPSKLKYYIVILLMIYGTLYVDYITGRITNVLIFFLSTVIYPILFIALFTKREGMSLGEALGFKGDFIYAASMLLLSGGLISLIFFVVTQPLASIFRGTSMYKAIIVLYMPLSTKPFWFTTVTPTFDFIFYTTVSIGEEILKLWGWKIVANWLFKKFGTGKTPIIIVGLLISFLGWLSTHFISWGGLPEGLPEGIIMGIFLSIVFMIPYYLGEPIISPESGIQLNVFSIYAPIGGHLMYDFWLAMMQDGFLATLGITAFFGIMISVTMLVVGGILLAFKYMQIKMGWFEIRI